MSFLTRKRPITFLLRLVWSGVLILWLFNVDRNCPSLGTPWQHQQRQPPPANLTVQKHPVGLYDYLKNNCSLDELQYFRRPFSTWAVTSTANEGISPPPQVYYLTGRFHHDREHFREHLNRYRAKMRSFDVIEPGKEIIYYEFPPDVRTNPVYASHLQFLKDPTHESSRGGGYWFWKGLLIYRHLQLLKDGDFLIFSDADMLDHFAWLSSLIEFMVDEGTNVAVHEITTANRNYCKRDVYEAYCPTQRMLTDRRKQLASGFVVLRKDAATLQFAELWMKGKQDYHAVSDEPSRVEDIHTFREHRHDQSILTLILHCLFKVEAAKYFPYTCLGDWDVASFALSGLETIPHIQVP